MVDGNLNNGNAPNVLHKGDTSEMVFLQLSDVFISGPSKLIDAIVFEMVCHSLYSEIRKSVVSY